MRPQVPYPISKRIEEDYERTYEKTKDPEDLKKLELQRCANRAMEDRDKAEQAARETFTNRHSTSDKEDKKYSEDEISLFVRIQRVCMDCVIL